MNRFVTILIFSGLIIVSSCAPYLKQPMQTSEARLGPPSSAYEELTSLPAPKTKIVAAVYKFRDQTGQYKLTESGSSWSTAVTQGATTILLRSLEESNWFIPIEREGLSNLLNERKIIRSSRANYITDETNNDQPVLPPLLFADILLEGGIISYESNVLTGGIGAKYFGAGGSAEYREDRITIYLRAISTRNGQILKTVYTTKTILSQEVDFGIFRYVSYKRLLEAETGFTFNEPSEMAIKEAIDKAVFSLIIEGAMGGLWLMKEEKDMEADIIQSYILEKEENKSINYLGYKFKQERTPFLLTISAGASVLSSDYPDAVFHPMFEVGAGFFKDHAVSLDLNLSYSTIENETYFKSQTIDYNTGLHYRFSNILPHSPFVNLGFGGITLVDSIKSSVLKQTTPYILVGLGYEQLITSNLEISFRIRNKIMLDDKLDKIKYGKYNDSIWEFGIGLNYYF